MSTSTEVDLLALLREQREIIDRQATIIEAQGVKLAEHEEKFQLLDRDITKARERLAYDAHQVAQRALDDRVWKAAKTAAETNALALNEKDPIQIVVPDDSKRAPSGGRFRSFSTSGLTVDLDRGPIAAYVRASWWGARLKVDDELRALVASGHVVVKPMPIDQVLRLARSGELPP